MFHEQVLILRIQIVLLVCQMLKRTCFRLPLIQLKNYLLFHIFEQTNTFSQQCLWNNQNINNLCFVSYCCLLLLLLLAKKNMSYISESRYWFENIQSYEKLVKKYLFLYFHYYGPYSAFLQSCLTTYTYSNQFFLGIFSNKRLPVKFATTPLPIKMASEIHKAPQ